MKLVKAFGHYVASWLWDHVSSIFILTGEIGIKLGLRNLRVFSGQKGHLACVKGMQHCEKALRLLGKENLIK